MGVGEPPSTSQFNRNTEFNRPDTSKLAGLTNVGGTKWKRSELIIEE